MTSFDVLPQELRLQILLQLPPTSIFALRLVCKSWNSILSSSDTERAISDSLLFPSTAPNLRSRLLRRQRLLHGDPVQIRDLDNYRWYRYCNGYLVTLDDDGKGSEILGIWNCRKKVYGRVAKVDVYELVRQLYSNQRGEAGGLVKPEDPHDIPRLSREFSTVENGVILLVIQFEKNRRLPRYQRAFLLFSLATGAMLNYIPQPTLGSVLSANLTSSILLISTTIDPADSEKSHNGRYYKTQFYISTYSIANGSRLQTSRFTPTPLHPINSHYLSSIYAENTITLDNLDQYYTQMIATDSQGQRSHCVSIHCARTGKHLTTIVIDKVDEGVAKSESWKYSSTIFADGKSGRIHFFDITVPKPGQNGVIPPSNDEEKRVQATWYTSWNAATPHRRKSVMIPAFDRFDLPGAFMNMYFEVCRWGFVLGEYHNAGRCWVWNLSGDNEGVVTIPENKIKPWRRETLPFRGHTAPRREYPASGNSWLRKMLGRIANSRYTQTPVTPAPRTSSPKVSRKEARKLEEETVPRTLSPPFPAGVVAACLPGNLNKASFCQGDDGVWILRVQKRDGRSSNEADNNRSLQLKTVIVSFDQGLKLPSIRELRRQ